ncbi:MAG: 50S ribosomal protein L28 [Candidatus Marinimicrobia bacterium]|nr:50S ribosomal protein L28 [Candidatus Neomarinimicrobiota bacterium]MCF7839246.1 50S ribosomal protein L28 [Candidatus Neomarinimicrobiota bacterium]
MAQFCKICGKGPRTGNNVSHSHKKSRRRWLPNLQRVRIMLDGRPVRVRVCTTCIKSDRIVKAA